MKTLATKQISGKNFITWATSSLTAGMDAIGTNTAHSMRLSCPRISVFMMALSRSVMRAVYDDVLVKQAPVATWRTYVVI